MLGLRLNHISKRGPLIKSKAHPQPNWNNTRREDMLAANRGRNPKRRGRGLHPPRHSPCLGPRDSPPCWQQPSWGGRGCSLCGNPRRCPLSWLAARGLPRWSRGVWCWCRRVQCRLDFPPEVGDCGWDITWIYPGNNVFVLMSILWNFAMLNLFQENYAYIFYHFSKLRWKR